MHPRIKQGRTHDEGDCVSYDIFYRVSILCCNANRLSELMMHLMNFAVEIFGMKSPVTPVKCEIFNEHTE